MSYSNLKSSNKKKIIIASIIAAAVLILALITWAAFSALSNAGGRIVLGGYAENAAQTSDEIEDSLAEWEELNSLLQKEYGVTLVENEVALGHIAAEFPTDEYGPETKWNVDFARYTHVEDTSDMEAVLNTALDYYESKGYSFQNREVGASGIIQSVQPEGSTVENEFLMVTTHEDGLSIVKRTNLLPLSEIPVWSGILTQAQIDEKYGWYFDEDESNDLDLCDVGFNTVTGWQDCY